MISKAEKSILLSVAEQVDTAQLGGVLQGASEVLAAQHDAAKAAQGLARAKMIREVDHLAFEVRTPETTKIHTDKSPDFVDAELYLATWSKRKEVEFQEQGHLASYAETPEKACYKMERDLVVSLAGKALLEWEAWLGPVPWLSPTQRLSDFKANWGAELLNKALESQRDSMMEDLTRYYKNKQSFELLSIDFVVRRPSFTLPNPALHSFFSDLIHGANVMLKIRIPRVSVNQVIRSSLGELLGHSSLTARAFEGGLWFAVMMAFGRRPEMARIIASFLPRAKDIRPALTKLASHHRARSEADQEKAKRLLQGRGITP